MRVFAIADPHLSRAFPKPMDIFGSNWQGHPGLFFRRWRETVREEDLVVIAGDLSWALRLPEAMLDLEDIGALPGRKVILRGNHDYWWPSIGRLRQVLPPGMFAIQNDALVIGGLALAGSRGWITPRDREFTNEDDKIYRRELERLRLSLEACRKLSYQKFLLALHYPPTAADGEPTGFTELIEQYRPDAVVYGHLHGAAGNRVMTAWDGIPMHLVAADFLSFYPKLIFELPGSG